MGFGRDDEIGLTVFYGADHRWHWVYQAPGSEESYESGESYTSEEEARIAGEAYIAKIVPGGEDDLTQTQYPR